MYRVSQLRDVKIERQFSSCFIWQWIGWYVSGSESAVYGRTPCNFVITLSRARRVRGMYTEKLSLKKKNS